jgi:DNA mismatch repair protein MutL
MRRTIRVLPEQLANRIAAGEVVERPASAAKELLENSIDAGATEVTLELFPDGFRIIDNGCGMTKDECLLALERHATSKIGEPEDLDNIMTLGFRGEALPSIASVSRFRLQSRPADEAVGTEVLVEGGNLAHVREAGIPVGTSIEVRDLFFNTPARKKFMKSAATENGHIRENFSRLAMAYPDVGFRLMVEGRTTIDVPSGISPRDRAARLLGKEFARQSVEFARKSGTLGYGVAGLLGHPRDNRARPDEVYWFVNGRFIRDRSLNHALVRAYHEFMPDNRFPRAAIFLTLPAGDVDVNVHPTKQEVRFAKPRELYGFIASSITEALEEWMREDPNPGLPKAMAFAQSARPARFFSAPVGPQVSEAQTQAYQSEQFFDSPGMLRRKETIADVRVPEASGDAGFYGRLAFLGQALGTYLVCQSDDGIVLIDQHAAHERVTYSAMLEAYRSGKPPVQGMLVPQVIELPPVATQALVEQQALLASIGFEVAEFGGNSISVHGVPAPLAGREIRRVLVDVAQELSELGRAQMAEQAVAERIIGCACQGSVRANQPLSEPEVRALLRQLDEIERAGNCPHGRPVVVTLSRAELERRFGRTQ